MEKIILLGAGGHCKSVLDTLLEDGRYQVEGIVDREEQKGIDVLGYEVTYKDEDLERLYTQGIQKAFVTIGGIGDYRVRYRLYKKLKTIGYELPIIQDQTAIVSPYATLQEGVYVGKNSTVNAAAHIGKMAIINTASVIEHDVKIGAFGSVAPGSIILGGACIGAYTHIGSGSIVRETIEVGAHSLVGMGSVVIQSIGSHKKAYGNPCKEVEKW